MTGVRRDEAAEALEDENGRLKRIVADYARQGMRRTCSSENFQAERNATCRRGKDGMADIDPKGLPGLSGRYVVLSLQVEALRSGRS